MKSIIQGIARKRDDNPEAPGKTESLRSSFGREEIGGKFSTSCIVKIAELPFKNNKKEQQKRNSTDAICYIYIYI